MPEVPKVPEVPVVQKEPEVSKLDAMIIKWLFQNDRTSKFRAVKVADIELNIKDKKDNTIYKRLTFLHKLGYVERGMKDGRYLRFYITDNGINYYYKEIYQEGEGEDG